MLWFHLTPASRKVKLTDREGRMVVTRIREGRKGSSCLMGTKFQFCKIKTFQKLVSQWCEYSVILYKRIPKNGYDGKFYVFYTLKKLEKRGDFWFSVLHVRAWQLPLYYKRKKLNRRKNQQLSWILKKGKSRGQDVVSKTRETDEYRESWLIWAETQSGECCLNSAGAGRSELPFVKCWRLYVDKSYANKFDNLDESYLQTQHNTYKISTTFFAEMEKLIVKFIWDCKGGPNSQNNFKKEKLKGLTHIPISKLTTEL